MNTVLEAKGITKQFPGVLALDKVDFDLRKGEVHIIVGENGAGKSTLGKIIAGFYNKDEGQLYLNGKEVFYKNTSEALKLGISIVSQEMSLVPYLNVAQNIFLNREPKIAGFIDHKKMQDNAREILKSLNCGGIDVKADCAELTVAQQQMVEIAKVLSFEPRIIVFDEPTATLSDKEVDSLFERILYLKSQGIAIIYVSHRMKEFARIGDRITVLRDGKKIKTINQGDLSEEQLVNLMIGRDISQVFHRTESRRPSEALRISGLSDREGRIENANLYINHGEIVSLAGIVGAGRTELAQLIFGLSPKRSGDIYIRGKVVKAANPQDMIKQHVGFVSEDRKKYGLVLINTISFNMLMVSLRKFFPHFIVKMAKCDSIADKYSKRLNVASPTVKKLCRGLSGGNQQKVVLAKWLSADPDILILDEPTRGIDVGAKMEIYSLMNDLAEQGKAILMISSEMAEVVGLSDRVYVMHEGKIIKELHKGCYSSDDLGAAMMGVMEVENETA